MLVKEFSRLKILVLRDNIITRTLLGWIQVMMPHDKRIREIGMHAFYEFTQGFDLLRRTRVSFFARRIKTALIADADGMPVMPYAVGTNFVQSPACLHRAVTTHHIVVADALPAFVLMPVVNVLGRAPLPGTDSRAMNDNQRNASHNCQSLAVNCASADATCCTERRQHGSQDVDDGLNQELGNLLLGSVKVLGHELYEHLRKKRIQLFHNQCFFKC